MQAKETPTHVFSCEICEFLRTSSFTKHLQWLILHVERLILDPAKQWWAKSSFTSLLSPSPQKNNYNGTINKNNKCIHYIYAHNAYIYIYIYICVFNVFVFIMYILLKNILLKCFLSMQVNTLTPYVMNIFCFSKQKIEKLIMN